MPSLDNAVVNGTRYGFVDIKISIDGADTIELLSIDYSDTIERGEVRGTRQQMIGMTRGDYKAEASFKLTKESYTALIALMGSGYGNRMFSIVVQYANDSEPLVTDEIVGCKIKSAKDSHSKGTDGLETEVELDVIKGIVRNGVTIIDDFQR